MKKIDCHTHIFNLHFIPVAGVIHDYPEVFLGEGRKIPVWICRLIANHYLKKMTYPLRREEFIKKDYLVSLKQIFTVDAVENSFSLVETNNKELVDFINEEEGETELFELDLKAEQWEQLEQLGYSENTKIKTFLTNVLAITGILLIVVLILIVKILSKTLYAKFIEPHFNWFSFMTKPYKEIKDQMMDHYKEISLFVHLDMDMQAWYTPDEITFDYESQVLKISELTKESNGKLVPFYAYNPKNDLVHLKSALSRSDVDPRGYIGVKFYPPSGYFPLGNVKNPKWDERNIELFKYCILNDIPIMSHTNEVGMQAGYQAVKKGNPRYWRNVLNYGQGDNKPFKNLTLCLGHAGGEDPWFEKNTDKGNEAFFSSYAGEVYHLCTEYKNVYCDLSYLSQIVKDDNLKILRTRLFELIELSKNENKECLFEDKIIYGSDWHMLMQEHGYEEYLPKFKNIFIKKNEEVYENKFFTTNAIKYLNLPAYIEKFKDNFLSTEAVTHLKDLTK